MSDFVAQADDGNWESEVLKSSDLVMVDFWAVLVWPVPDGCSRCGGACEGI